MKKLLCSAVAALVLIGCSDNTKSPYEGKSAGFIYAKGHEYLQKGDYTDAVTAFEDLNSQYPFQQESKQGDLELIYAYYQKDDPALALASADRFLHLYPNDPNAA
ncbi:MAG: outer membrane protein assembly factor BamD, partial [Gammaproteobacteria bacterium]|nr:outer membrane protein assembly factor BamD [Gammaproteobacteria bacterium]